MVEIHFKFKEFRGGPFFSASYIATQMYQGKPVKNGMEETYPDYISPYANVLKDFGLDEKYICPLQERIKARNAILEGRDFVILLEFVGKERQLH